MSKVVGIDLGTTNSVIAVVEAGKPKVIVNSEGARTTPSIVGWNKKGERLVGQLAKRQSVIQPDHTIYSSKRFIGKQFKDIKDNTGKFPYKLVEMKDGQVGFQVNDKQYTCEEIGSYILAKLKKDAEDYLGTPVTQAVITVPAYFNDAQRQATKDAGKIAGLEVKRIINEPTSAALFYGLNKKGKKKVIVYDFGGGTFDVSLLEIDSDIIEVKATNGDTFLGGDDFDTLILDWILSEFKKSEGIDLSTDKMAIQRLRESAEKAKIELSSVENTHISLPFITGGGDTGPKHLDLNLSRAKFEQLTEDLVKRTIEPIKQVLKDSKYSTSDIDEIILVGGSTRIPLVQKHLTDFFGGKTPNRSLNPDEVVALGAATQGGIFTKEIEDVLLLDVTSLSLGIETLGGAMTRLIERNSTIPIEKSETFSTAQDNQSSVNIRIFQGERQMTADNQLLGEFTLSEIPPAPRGVPKINVIFKVDVNGTINVSAKNLETNKSQSITIKKPGLSESEVERLVQEAKAHAREDESKKELISEKNKLDNQIYSLEKLIKENGDKVEAQLKQKAEQAIQDARKNMIKSDISVSDAKDLGNRLQILVTELSQAVYQASKTNQAHSKDPDPGTTTDAQNKTEDAKDKGQGKQDPDDKDVIDAKFKDVN